MVRAGQARGHPWLENAVARNDTLLVFVVARTIERVRHGTHKLPRRIACQYRIGIQGDHVLHARQDRGITDDESEAITGPSAQKPIQIRKLAALSLVSHPDPVLRIPSSRAMKQEEGIAVRTPVLLVKVLNSLLGQPQQRPVLRQRFLDGVANISEQSKVEVVIPIRQKADLQCLDQILDISVARDHRWDHHQGPQFLRDPFGEVHSRQRPRRQQQRRHPVNQGDRQMTGAQKREQSDQPEWPALQSAGRRLRREAPGENSRYQQDGAAIQQQREPAADLAQHLSGREAHPRDSLEQCQSLVEQVEPDVRRPVVAAFLSRSLMRQLDRFMRHLALRVGAVLRRPLHGVAAVITGGKVHLVVDVGRVLTQGLLDGAHRFDELAPVHRAQGTEAADAVAHRDLVGRLLLVLRAHQLLDGQASLGQSLFNPGERHGQSGALALQTARELRHK